MSEQAQAETAFGQPSPPAEPVTKCGACGQEDDHPKHQILVGFQNANTGGQMFHEHDEDRDGVIQYHFDCPTPYHSMVHPEHHAKLAALAGSGVKGADLRARIVGGEI